MHEVNTCFTYCNKENIYHVKKNTSLGGFPVVVQREREREDIKFMYVRLETIPACYQETVQFAERLDILQT